MMKLFNALLILGAFAANASANDLTITYLGKRVLQKWSTQDLKKLGTRRLLERPLSDKKTVSFEGPTLDQILLETLTKQLSVEERALIDLVILKEKSGKEIFIPRSFITKYPVVYDHGKIAPPLSTRPKATEEGLPVQSYFLNNVYDIDLAHSKERFEKAYLKNRSDPAAVRGEKFFVQTCLGCHGASLNPTNNTQQILNHKPLVGFPNLNKKISQSLESYLQAYAKENTNTVTDAKH